MTHPLFPIENDDEDEGREIAFIHVTRFEGGGQKWAPRLFAADELTDLAQLSELYGGGSFELVARDEKKQRITARKRYQLGGAPLPLAEDAGPARMPVTTEAPRAAPAGGMSDGVMVAMMQMMAQLQQSQTQMVVAMMQRGDQSSKEHTQSMAALHDRFASGQAQLFSSLFSAMKSGGGEGGGGAEAFMKGVEWAAELKAGLEEGSEPPDDTMAQMVEGLKAFAMMQNTPPPPQVVHAPDKAPAAPRPPANGQGQS